jgi:hypothetical protein
MGNNYFFNYMTEDVNTCFQGSALREFMDMHRMLTVEECLI